MGSIGDLVELPIPFTYVVSTYLLELVWYSILAIDAAIKCYDTADIQGIESMDSVKWSAVAFAIAYLWAVVLVFGVMRTTANMMGNPMGADADDLPIFEWVVRCAHRSVTRVYI